MTTQTHTPGHMIIFQLYTLNMTECNKGKTEFTKNEYCLTVSVEHLLQQ